MLHVLVIICLLTLHLTYDAGAAAALSIDRHGYILYCPCMGKSCDTHFCNRLAPISRWL